MDSLAYLKAMVGREELVQSGTIELSTVQRYAAAVHETHPFYWDEEAARAGPFGRVIAPPTMLFEINFNTLGEIGEDGSYPQMRLVPGMEVIRAGNEYEVLQNVRVGDVVKTYRKIVDAYTKQGRSGQLLFAVLENRYVNQDDAVVARNRETLILVPARSKRGAG